MEEDEDSPDSIPPWVKLEYAVSRQLPFTMSSHFHRFASMKHMRTLAGPDAEVHFTHLSKSSAEYLTESTFIDDHPGNPSLLSPFFCHQAGVLDLMKSKGVSIDHVCLLDPKSEQRLSPEDGDGRFEWFLFGVRDKCKIFLLE